MSEGWKKAKNFKKNAARGTAFSFVLYRFSGGTPNKKVFILGSNVFSPSICGIKGSKASVVSCISSTDTLMADIC